jgi:tripartite ATP-independent transporter DctP family solute receptor
MKLGKLFLAMSIAMSFAAGASAQTTMKISISTAQNSHQGVGIDTFAREVEKRTSGRIKVQPFYSGSLGGERESIEAVQLGTHELTFTSTGPVPNFVPETRILDIPFLFRDKPHARAVLDGPIGQDLLTKFETKGMKALAWGENGVRHMTNSKRAVNGPDDLKGLKMRTMENPVHIAAYKNFGIVPTPMAFPEVFTALQQGTVDGQENPLSVIMAAKFEQVQKHLSLTGPRVLAGDLPDEQGAFDKLCAGRQQHFLEPPRKPPGQPRPRGRGRRQGRGRAALQGHAGGGERRQGPKFVARCAGECRVREAVRQGQHRHDPQLQVIAGCSAHAPAVPRTCGRFHSSGQHETAFLARARTSGISLAAPA